MLSAVVRSARASVAAAAAHAPPQQRQQVAALARQISSSRFSVDRPMNKKETDACYNRIAAKLEKTNNAASMDAIDRTITYLQEIGLTKSLALSAVAMHPMMIGYLASTMDEKVNWLRANGVTGPLLVRAIARHPNILGVREQALLDVKEWYIAHGVHPSKLPFLISVFPHAVSTSIRENLEPKRQFLIEQGLSHRQVVGVLQRCPQFMSLSLDCLESKVVFLKKRGLSADAITKLIASTPEVLGLSPDSVDAKLSALDALLRSRDATIQAWSSNPRVIMCKSEPVARAYAYLVNVVGMPHERVVRNVGMIMRSVDRITRPRFEFLTKTYALDRVALTEKSSWIMISDAIFQERFPKYEGGAKRAASTAAPATATASAAV